MARSTRSSRDRRAAFQNPELVATSRSSASTEPEPAAAAADSRVDAQHQHERHLRLDRPLARRATVWNGVSATSGAVRRQTLGTNKVPHSARERTLAFSTSSRRSARAQSTHRGVRRDGDSGGAVFIRTAATGSWRRADRDRHVRRSALSRPLRQSNVGGRSRAVSDQSDQPDAPRPARTRSDERRRRTHRLAGRSWLRLGSSTRPSSSTRTATASRTPPTTAGRSPTRSA